MSMLQYRIKEGQSIFDVALQLYGDVTKARKILFDNPGVIANYNSPNLAGVVINYDLVENETLNKINRLQRIINTSDPKIISGAEFDDSFNDSFTI